MAATSPATKPARWLIPQPASREIALFAASLGIRQPAARVLWNRNIRNPQQAAQFLQPSLDQLHDPLLLAGMATAVDRIVAAIARKESILLYGDYDVDGTSSVVMLKKGIEIAGGSAAFHIPHRLKEGYGMKPEVIEQAARDGVHLIVSVDTGIRAGDVVRHANQLGIDVIVTDHHLPESELPPALAVLNPNRPDCHYPEKNLCGAGVVFKLLQALFSRLGWTPEKQQRMVESFLKLAAIATVADVVPLTGENRIIVKLGLEGLRDVRNPGLRALIEVAGLNPGEPLTAGQVGFRIGPRLNAAGRMDDAAAVIELLLTADAARAHAIATQLHDLNTTRQQTEADIVRRVLEECVTTPVTDNHSALVFSGKDWHRGVVGIVASRLVERFHRPVFVLSEENGEAQGSGRSIAAFHLLEALESMSHLFLRFGGHRQAAGLGMRTALVADFRESLNLYASSRLTVADFSPTLELDSALDLSEATDEAVAEVLSLAPFGMGNPTPLFAVHDAEVAAPPELWKEKHLIVRLRQGGRNLRLKAWNFAGRIAEFERGAHVDVAINLEDDAYSANRGYSPWCAVLRDVRPAT